MESQITQTTILKITNQEQQFINHCSGKSVIAWEELAQYAKSPTTVKLKTLQKAISDLKKKYRDAGLPLPFICSFVSLLEQNVPVETKPIEQKLVQLRTTKGGNWVAIDDVQPDAHIDFKLEPYYKRVRTRTGIINLSDNEWELFNLFHANIGKMFSMDDIKNVVYKDFGSKTPHCWAQSIKRTLTNLRTNIRELKTDNRLVCVMGGNTTFYMLK